MNKTLLIAVIAAIVPISVLIIAMSTAKVKRDANASVVCISGEKWIKDRAGNLTKWVDAQGMTPTCKN
jgi:hypothetical protein